MRSLDVSESTRFNPIVADQIALLYDSIQEEVCGVIESFYGKLGPSPQLSIALFQKYYLKNSPSLREICRLWGEETKKYSFQMPDPYSVFAGFFTLSFWRDLVLLHRSEVFFQFDFRKSTWLFTTQPGCPALLSYDSIGSLLVVQIPGSNLKGYDWVGIHIDQMRYLSR